MDYIEKQYPLISTNRIRTGGNALYYARVTTLAHLQHISTFAHERALPFYVLGKGSNVLISDEDFNGVVIKLEGEFKSISFDYSTQTVTAGAGVSLIKLGIQLARQGYRGCAYMGVIPGTIGGAVRMNAGTAPEQEIKNDFISARVFNPFTGNITEYSRDTMVFGYRKSVLSESGDIILQATFKLPASKEAHSYEAFTTIKNLHALRRSKNPKNFHTFGSTFKNPRNHPHAAGWYLEKVDMKGMRVGGALVSCEHANWIINIDNAKSADIKKLIEIAQKRVYNVFGIELEREVIYLPEDIIGQRK